MSKRVLSTFVAPVLLAALCVGVLPVSAQTSHKKPAATKAAAKPSQPGDEYPRPPMPAKHYTIGVLLPMLSNPHFVGQAYGYIDEANHLGARVILHDAGGYQYIEKQVSQMEDLIASKVDAIDLVATNGSATVPAVDEAIRHGIPVINCNVMTDSNKVSARIRSDDSVAGRMEADYMAKALNGKGDVVMLRGPAGTSWAQIRGDSFKKRMAEVAPGIKIVGEQYSQSTPAEGMRLMEDFMQTYPHIDGVYNGADMTAIGANQSILAAGKGGKIVTTAVTSNRTAKSLCAKGYSRRRWSSKV